MSSEVKVKLFNKSKSTIFYGNPPQYDENNKAIPDPMKGSIKPDECVAFEPELAAKLKRMYPKKLLSLEDVRDQFENPVKSSPETKRDMQTQISEAVAAALPKAIAAAVEKALDEERVRVAKEQADKLEKEGGKKKSEKDEKKLVEETEDELMARLEKEEAEAKKSEKKADKK